METRAFAIFASGADRLSIKVIGTYNALAHAFQHRREYARSWISFGDCLCRLALSQVPPLLSPITELGSLFTALGQVHEVLSQTEQRAAEDVRDIIERFVVVYNSNQAYHEVREVYESAMENVRLHWEKMQIQSARLDYELQRPKLEQELSALKEKQYAALTRFKPALHRNIVQRERYIQFKARKFREGFRGYAVALKSACEKEIEIYGKMKEILVGLEEALPIEIEEQVVVFVDAPPPEVVPVDALREAMDAVESGRGGLIQGQPLFTDW
jgi:hypothetical protein